MKHFQYITILSWKELCQAAYKLKSNLPLCFQLARLKRDALKCLGLNVRQVILKKKEFGIKKKIQSLINKELKSLYIFIMELCFAPTTSAPLLWIPGLANNAIFCISKMENFCFEYTGVFLKGFGFPKPLKIEKS